MRRLFAVTDKYLAQFASALAPWWWECNYCGQRTQGGSLGSLHHVRAIHPRMKLSAIESEAPFERH